MSSGALKTRSGRSAVEENGHDVLSPSNAHRTPGSELSNRTQSGYPLVSDSLDTCERTGRWSRGDDERSIFPIS